MAASGGASAADICKDGTTIFCDDFNGPVIDAAKWQIANTNIAHKHKVRPANIALVTIEDEGTRIGVVDAQSFGDLHVAAPRQGGILITRNRYAAGRYEVRMKNLPGAYGCSCIWNYFDSRNQWWPLWERAYTEIDIEMPAHIEPADRWTVWRRKLGLNTWSRTDVDADATFINHLSAIDPFDGRFHIFRFDWRVGANGVRRIDWYLDGVLQASTNEHVSDKPAQLWVGTWPAPWAGMRYDFDVKHLYIDWVRISAFDN